MIDDIEPTKDQETNPEFDPPVLESEAEPEPAPVDSVYCGTITVKRGGAATDVVFPVSPPAVIGRFDPALGPIDVDLGDLPEGAYVSRKHAKLDHDGTSWRLSDLGSSNGTFILRASDFERIEDDVIKDGEEFALGNARFLFHDVTPAP